ncbi:MAG: DNA repair protein RecO [Bacillota bacterium]|nr:DNA repair protein RecO [Bacillota bacterium]
MYTETEGIVFRQTKIINGRRMILLFSRRYGKISAGTSVTEKGKGKAALALRPFVYGRYDLAKTRENYFINGGDVLRSHFAIGGDVDKYMAASYIMELTEKLLPEEAPAPELFSLLLDFLDAMEKRKQKFGTLVLAYQAKALRSCGSFPRLDACVSCGGEEQLCAVGIKEGGALCKSCVPEIYENDRLIYNAEFDIVNILRFLSEQPLDKIAGLALEEGAEKTLRMLLSAWTEEYLGVGRLKSEGFFPEPEKSY